MKESFILVVLVFCLCLGFTAGYTKGKLRIPFTIEEHPAVTKALHNEGKEKYSCINGEPAEFVIEEYPPVLEYLEAKRDRVKRKYRPVQFEIEEYSPMTRAVERRVRGSKEKGDNLKTAVPFEIEELPVILEYLERNH